MIIIVSGLKNRQYKDTGKKIASLSDFHSFFRYYFRHLLYAGYH